LILVIAVVVAGYFVSLRLHPFRSCPACKNRLAPGRHHGFVYGYAHRRCRRCGGTNRQERFGTRMGWGAERDDTLPGRGRGGA
jgi:formamidopyrimidine-DNA glycosylase